MAERNYIPPKTEPFKQSNFNANTLAKRWKVANILTKGSVNKDRNQLVETYYKEILELVKRLYPKLTYHYSKTVFEKDYRQDNSENCFSMHWFLTPCFYWHLECDFAYNYRIDYDFDNCPFEAEITVLIDKRFNQIPNCDRKKLKPSLKCYYQSVLEVQDSKFIHQLI